MPKKTHVKESCKNFRVLYHAYSTRTNGRIALDWAEAAEACGLRQAYRLSVPGTPDTAGTRHPPGFRPLMDFGRSGHGHRTLGPTLGRRLHDPKHDHTRLTMPTM